MGTPGHDGNILALGTALCPGGVGIGPLEFPHQNYGEREIFGQNLLPRFIKFIIYHENR